MRHGGIGMRHGHTACNARNYAISGDRELRSRPGVWLATSLRLSQHAARDGSTLSRRCATLPGMGEQNCTTQDGTVRHTFGALTLHLGDTGRTVTCACGLVSVTIEAGGWQRITTQVST